MIVARGRTWGGGNAPVESEVPVEAGLRLKRWDGGGGVEIQGPATMKLL